VSTTGHQPDILRVSLNVRGVSAERSTRTGPDAPLKGRPGVWAQDHRKPICEPLIGKGASVRGRGKALGPIDLHVASRLRERRIVLGISQPKLAATLGLTFQQVYNYEQGRNRISAGRLYEFGKVLGVPITFFFEGTADALTPAVPLALGDHADELGRREAIELFTAYRGISDPVLRRSLRELARALGSETKDVTGPATAQSRRPLRRVRK
jgi:transcriptional regulator with XRE-family HTH domain